MVVRMVLSRVSIFIWSWWNLGGSFDGGVLVGLLVDLGASLAIGHLLVRLGTSLAIHGAGHLLSFGCRARFAVGLLRGNRWMITKKFHDKDKQMKVLN